MLISFRKIKIVTVRFVIGKTLFYVRIYELISTDKLDPSCATKRVNNIINEINYENSDTKCAGIIVV